MSSMSSGRRVRAGAGRATTLGVAAVAALALSACGSGTTTLSQGDLAPVTAGSTPSGGATASAGSTPSGSATPSATPSASSSASPSASGSSGSGAAGEVVDASAEVEVEDQRGDGRGVRVEQARLSAGSGWVAVYDRSGSLLGAAPVTAGSQPVTIPLQVRVTGSTELLAVLHVDDGDGAFDVSRDAVVVDEDGEREDEDFDYVVG